MAPVDVTEGASALAPGTPRAVAIGNFDGVHLGHVALIGHSVTEAKRRDLAATVLTFSPHPARVLAPDRAPPLLVPEARKLALIAGLGVQAIVRQPFDAKLAAMTPRAFCEELLAGAMNAKLVCVGYDFTFGSKRAGTTDVLRALGDELGFEVQVTPAVRVDDVICSSSAIRTRLADGDIEAATALLGRAPELEGVVVHGAHRGRTIGFPTANVAIENEAPVKPGVYAGLATLPDGTARKAAINIGRNPTFVDKAPITVEAYLLGFAGDVYGARIRLGLTRRIRDEQKFASIDALVAQIRADVASVERL